MLKNMENSFSHTIQVCIVAKMLKILCFLLSHLNLYSCLNSSLPLLYREATENASNMTNNHEDLKTKDISN